VISLPVLLLSAVAVFSCGACGGAALLALWQGRGGAAAAPVPGALRGSMDALSLGTLLQVLEQEHRSASITLRSGESVGWIVCQEGQIAHARMEEQRVLLGRQAVRGMLAWEGGSYVLTQGEVKLAAPGPRLPITPLLIESAKREDEDEQADQAAAGSAAPRTSSA